MDEDRINEIGKKLDITSSDVKNSTLYKFRMLPFYIAGQIGLLLLTIGYASNLHPKGGWYATYPSTYEFYYCYAFLNLLPFHTVNGVFCFKKEELFGLNRRTRISLFVLTLIVSLAFYYLIVNSFPPYTGPSIMYGVFDKNECFKRKGISKLKFR